jgi:hypothetical protein
MHFMNLIFKFLVDLAGYFRTLLIYIGRNFIQVFFNVNSAFVRSPA